MNINNILDSIQLQIYKSRNVKCPKKAWGAAGWDFFIPEDLSIFDFMNNVDAYLDPHVKYDKNFIFDVPLVFYLISNRSIGEFATQIKLIWDSLSNGWKFGIVNYNENKDKLIDLDNAESENPIVSWLLEKDTVISRIEILPHGSINIPSGIHVNLPENVFLSIANKSGIGSKRRLSYLAQIIDSDYTGEIHLNIINESEYPVEIEAGEKIVQAIPLFQPNMNDVIEYKSKDELYKNKNSSRGEGGFGSSGKK